MRRTTTTVSVTHYQKILAPVARAWDAPLPRTVSLSKQFVIYCDDAQARGSVASFAETTKQKLLALLDQHDPWKYPIVINLIRPDAAHPARLASNVALYEI